MSYFTVSQEQIAQFREDGFLMIENMFSQEEIALAEKIARADKEKATQVRASKDTQGGESRLWLTSGTHREDSYNGFCHGQRIVRTMEKLLDNEAFL